MPRGCTGAIREAAINDACENVARPVTVRYYYSRSLKVLNRNVMNFPGERNLLFLS